MNNQYPAAEESLTKVLSDNKYKECTEVIRLLAKVKQLQGDKFEAMAHFRRMIELNPSDHQSQFEIAQLFDLIDMPMALMYYEQGYRNLSLEIEKRHKFSAET